MISGRSAWLRALLLDLKVRFRTVGIWPWLALGTWGLVARLQDPADVFRPFGIYVCLQAVWFGATILLASLILAAPRSSHEFDIRHSVFTSVLVLAIVALAQAALGFTLDVLIPAELEPARYLASCWTFVVVWLPAVAAWSNAGRVSAKWARAVQWSALGVSVCLAVPASRDVPWRPISASLLATAAVLGFRVSPRTPTPYQAGTRPAGVQP